MVILFLINFLLVNLLTFFPIYYQTKFFKLNWFNPLVLFYLVSVPIVIFINFLGPLYGLEKGLLDPYYNFSLLMGNVSSLITCLILVFLLRIFKKKIFRTLISRFQSYRFKRVRLFGVGWLFLAVFFISFFLLASHSYGVINWITHPRTGYQFHRSGAGQYYALSLSMLSVAFVLFTISAKRNISVIFILLIFLPIVYLLGSKSYILAFFLYAVVILWFRRYKYLKRLFFLGLPFIFILILINFGRVDFASFANYFSHHVNSAAYYEAYFSGKLDLLYGKIWITDFWSLVPRAYFPEKPYVYGILHINEYFFPGAAAATNTPAFAGPIKEFGDFGVFGVILGPIFNFSSHFQVFLMYLLYSNRNMEEILNNSNRIFLFLWIFGPAFLTYFPTPLNLILFFLVVKTISIGSRIVVQKRNVIPN
jgi:hypothetical protein